MELVEAIVDFFAKNGRESERLGEVIERITMKMFKQKLGLS